MSHRQRDLGYHPFEHISRVVGILRRLAFQGLEHISREGPALLATTHSSPLDLFYHLSFMRRLGRSDYSFIMAGELLDDEAFRSYTRDSLEASLPAIGAHLGFVSDRLSKVVPPLLRRLNAIPVYRDGDDSESRRRSLECLLQGQLVTIAPGWGDDRHRDTAGMRPLTHGVASIARRYFDATREALDVVPVAICKSGPRLLRKITLHIGPPFVGMSDRAYPDLFSASGGTDAAVKHAAYQDYTRQLADRLSELLA